MNVTALIIQLLSGAAGGSVVAALVKKLDLGPLCNLIAGILGGALGGQLLGLLSAGAAGGGALDLGSIISSIVGGGVGGGVLLTLVSLVKQAMAKPPSS